MSLAPSSLKQQRCGGRINRFPPNGNGRIPPSARVVRIVVEAPRFRPTTIRTASPSSSSQSYGRPIPDIPFYSWCNTDNCQFRDADRGQQSGKAHFLAGYTRDINGGGHYLAGLTIRRNVRLIRSPTGALVLGRACFQKCCRAPPMMSKLPWPRTISILRLLFL
jgi:hypothetical protein